MQTNLITQIMERTNNLSDFSATKDTRKSPSSLSNKKSNTTLEILFNSQIPENFPLDQKSYRDQLQKYFNARVLSDSIQKHPLLVKMIPQIAAAENDFLKTYAFIRKVNFYEPLKNIQAAFKIFLTKKVKTKYRRLPKEGTFEVEFITQNDAGEQKLLASCKCVAGNLSSAKNLAAFEILRIVFPNTYKITIFKFNTENETQSFDELFSPEKQNLTGSAQGNTSNPEQNVAMDNGHILLISNGEINEIKENVNSINFSEKNSQNGLNNSLILDELNQSSSIIDAADKNSVKRVVSAHSEENLRFVSETANRFTNNFKTEKNAEMVKQTSPILDNSENLEKSQKIIKEKFFKNNDILNPNNESGYGHNLDASFAKNRKHNLVPLEQDAQKRIVKFLLVFSKKDYECFVKNISYNPDIELLSSQNIIEKSYFAEKANTISKELEKPFLLQNAKKAFGNKHDFSIEKERYSQNYELKTLSSEIILLDIHFRENNGRLTPLREVIEKILLSTIIGVKNPTFLDLLTYFLEVDQNMDKFAPYYSQVYDSDFQRKTVTELEPNSPLYHCAKEENITIEKVKIVYSANLSGKSFNDLEIRSVNDDFASMLNRTTAANFKTATPNTIELKSDQYSLHLELASNFDGSYLACELAFSGKSNKTRVFRLACLMLLYTVFDSFRAKFCAFFESTNKPSPHVQSDSPAQNESTYEVLYEEPGMLKRMKVEYQYQLSRLGPQDNDIIQIFTKTYKKTLCLTADATDALSHKVTGSCEGKTVFEIKLKATNKKDARRRFVEIIRELLNKTV